MKKILFVFLVSILLFSCSNSFNEAMGYAGKDDLSFGEASLVKIFSPLDVETSDVINPTDIVCFDIILCNNSNALLQGLTVSVSLANPQDADFIKLGTTSCTLDLNGKMFKNCSEFAKEVSSEAEIVWPVAKNEFPFSFEVKENGAGKKFALNIIVTNTKGLTWTTTKNFEVR